MTADEAIRDLLNVSTDIRAVAVLTPQGETLAFGPGGVATDLPEVAGRLWDAAALQGTSAATALDHVVVRDAAGAVAVLRAQDHRIVALTGEDPAVGLLLFDLRTCLADALSGAEPA